MIIQPDELARHLRIDAPSFDELAELSSFIRQAQGVCESFCRRQFDYDAPEPVRLAATLLCSHYFTFREASDPDAVKAIQMATENLLWPHRDESKMF